MNKIGLQIKRVSGGAAPMLTINPGEWTRKVVDIRDILKLYEITDESKFVTFMSFSETGTYITVLRPISGRDGDNTAAWIFIPNNIEVPGDDIIRLINDVKIELSKPTRDDIKLETAFRKEYPMTESAAYIPSAAEKIYAKRQGPFYPMKEILGTKRYQPYYNQYNAILIEDEDSMKVVDTKVEDISQKRLEETLVFCPPIEQDLRGGITVRFDDAHRTPFSSPVRRKLGDRINIVFEREGFQPIRHIDQVCENNQICNLPRPMNWKVSIGLNRFKVSAANDGKNLTDRASIYVNNQRLTFNKPIELEEKEARKANVRITASGYEDKVTTVDFLYTPNVVEQLHRAEREQEWEINLTDGSPAVMTIKSKYLTQHYHESPIKGYSAEGRRLEYTNFGVLKQRAIGFGIACALFILTGICMCIYDWYDSHTFDWQFGWPPLKVEKIRSHSYSEVQNAQEIIPSSDAEVQAQSNDATQDDEYSDEKAIEYLDSNSAWVKSDMEKFPLLKGLFDDMNNFNTFRLYSHWGDKLSKSTRFTEVKKVAKKNSDNSWDPRQGTHSPNYNKVNDYSIQVTGYVYWLDQNRAPKPDKPKQQKAAEKPQPSNNKFNQEDLN
ncbi:MAG: hypothetical protein NC453_14170 [Muribaculum sp.]|nr:hypothetical protein [Muribaculum sp.]